jgi:hypothetical protein
MFKVSCLINTTIKLAEVCDVAIELYYQEVGLVLDNIYTGTVEIAAVF